MFTYLGEFLFIILLVAAVFAFSYLGYGVGLS